MKILQLFGISCLIRQQTYLLPVMLLWYQHNGLTASDFVFIQGIFILFGIFSEVPSGYLADIFSKKHILLCSFSLFLLRCILWLNFTGFYIILIGEMLVVLSRSLFQGIYDSYIYEFLEEKKQTDKLAKYYGIINSYLNIGTGSASLLCSFLYPRYALQTLLILELISTCVALVLMSMVPNIKKRHRAKTLQKHFSEMTASVKKTLSDKRINHYIVMSAIFASSTYIYIWNFQPIMKSTGVAVSIFGIVYVCNFSFRALAGYLSGYLARKINYNRLAAIVILHICIAFCGLAIAETYRNQYITLTVLLLICIGIGAQLLFHILTIASLQKITASDIRATASSSYNLVAQGIAGIMLSSFKFLATNMDFKQIYLLYLALYVVMISAVYLWHKANLHKEVS